jgi:hypothetical protein
MRGGEFQMGIAETSRIQVILSGIQNSTFGSYLAAIYRILIPVMRDACHATMSEPQAMQCVPIGGSTF